MEQLINLEKQTKGIYEKALEPLAERLSFELPVAAAEATGSPSVLFLGNHSSGKSSFINHLLKANLQKSGLAPTDDGFTIITYGEKKDEFDGQTVVTHPKLPYNHLQELGPDFLSRLRLKTHPSDLLKEITLIDSPGMIDAAGKTHSRGYDFTASVRYFAEASDLILFFFDPDKPGTTGETVSIFTETLAGLEYKLLIIMNKVDLFENIRDFARTYGTLCWNLSKTIKTKDIPHIYNTYLPDRAGPNSQQSAPALPLQDFDVSRDEVMREIQRTPTRRADNLVSDLYNNARKLVAHGRVCHEVSRRYRSLRNKLAGVVAALLLVTGFATWFAWGAQSWRVPASVAFIGLLVTVGTAVFSRFYMRQFKEFALSSEGLDENFDRAFRQELGLRDRADLRAVWQSVKKHTMKTLEVIGPSKIGSLYTLRRSLRRLEQVIDDDIPQLRREIGDYHAQRSEQAKAG